MATDDLGWLAAELEVTRAELRRVRSRLDAVTEHAADPVAIRDREGRYLFVNAAAAAIAGLSAGAYIGHTDTELFGPEIGEAVRGRDLRVMETGKPEHYRYEGEYANRPLDYLVSKWPWRDENGRVVGVVLHSRDVSEVAAASREAAYLAEGMRRLVEGLPDVVVIHRDGTVVYVNAAARKLWPPPSAGLEGSPLARLFTSANMSDLQGLLHAAPQPWAGELTVQNSEGCDREFAVRAIDTAWMGEAARAVMARDITDDRRAQAQLAATDRLAAVGTLASGIVHEVRNPLTFVTAKLSALQSDLSTIRREDIDELLDATRRMSEILADVARFGGTDREDASSTEVEAVLDRSLSLARGRMRAAVEVVRERGGVPPVLGGERRLCQVFLNLLMNAAQAAEGAPDPKVRISTFLSGTEVAIRFRDTGPGVPAGLARKIFEPFVTTKREGEGTGLGLWVSQGIVSAFGGRVVLENPGEPGASFVVFVPQAVALGDHVAPAWEPGRLSPSRSVADLPRLLVVDDEPLICDLLAMGLAKDFSVEVFGGVAPALERLRGGPPPDAILCDLIMPGGGAQALIRELERDGAPIPPVIFMSGGAATPDARRFLRSRAIQPIEKPFRISDVRSRIEQELSRR